MRAGIATLVAQVTAFARRCPGSGLYLAGFSEGAQVAGDAYLSWLTDAERGRVARLVLFGDPICNFSSVRDATDCAASPHCPHLFYGFDPMPGHDNETYTLAAARFLTGVAHGHGGPGGGLPDTPAPGPSPHVTPLAPNAGPEGCAFAIAGPPCVPAADETAEVEVPGDGYGSAHSQGWAIPASR